MPPSRAPGPIADDRFTLGPLGVDPPRFGAPSGGLLGAAPGLLGLAADTPSLGPRSLHLTISADRDLGLWDYDPKNLLDDERLNPQFVEAAHKALSTAVSFGLRPRVHEAYRDPAEADRRNKLWKEGKGSRAAAGWRSVHNYGLAMDVWLYDRKGKWIGDQPYKVWHPQYSIMNVAASAFVWGDSFQDGDHWEYHPAWNDGAGGAFLLAVKAWAIRAAMADPSIGRLPGGASGPVREPPPEAWLRYFWWAAGAGGERPTTLDKDPVPPPPKKSKK
jgi:hypothetical protein